MFGRLVHYFSKLFIMIGLCSACALSYAKPNLEPLGENIADQGSEYYQFTQKEFISQDQKRTYRVWLGIPKNNTQSHYKSMFMLDGNSVMSYLNENILKDMNRDDPAVIVAIGYQTNLPFDVVARAQDYTPSETGLTALQPDPRNPARMTGGRLEFHRLIVEDIAPWVEQKVKLDPTRRAIWGHSYGGLFVLDSALHENYFSHYFSASASLGWADTRMLKKIQTVNVTHPEKKTIVLMEGDVNLADAAVKSTNFDEKGITYHRQAAARFDSQKVKTQFILYPNLTHGEVFGASLLHLWRNDLYR